MKIKAKSISNISGTLFFSILFSMFLLISTSSAQGAFSSSINVDGYSVGYSITGGSILSIIPDVDAHSLIIKISSTSDGELTITLPRALIDAKYNGDDDNFFVLVDGVETDYDEKRTSSDRTLKIAFKAGAVEIEIIGNTLSGTTSSPTPEKEHEPEPTPAPPPPAPAEIDIKINIASAVPGCELSNSCFTPSYLSVDVGETITWYNADTAAHTVTSITPSGGPDGNFDSGLIMSGSTFSVTLTQPGTYTYFCMIHPWAIGEIIVQGSGTSSDTTPPQVIVPSDMTLDAGTADYAILEYSVKAIDDVDGVITPTCNLSSGSKVYVGDWFVTCTAKDSAGNVGFMKFMVTVTSSSDTTPPDITPPHVTISSDMTLDAGTADYAILEYSVKAIDDVDGVITPTCNLSSGSKVFVGVTTVTCTATNSVGHIGSAIFMVTVTSTLETAPAPTPASTPAPKPTPTPAPTLVPSTPNVHKLTQEKSVKVADGSSVPGCEEFYECYIPYSVRVRPGTPLYWTNFDSAAHTVTSGTPADGPDGIFDSSLFELGERFEVTLNNTGTYPYFCMVHPWMIGKVIVHGSPVTSIPTPASAGITVDSSVPSQNNDLSELIDENKKLREEVERQGGQIDELNQEVDLLKQIIQSIQGFFSSIFG